MLKKALLPKYFQDDYINDITEWVKADYMHVLLLIFNFPLMQQITFVTCDFNTILVKEDMAYTYKENRVQKFSIWIWRYLSNHDI